MNCTEIFELIERYPSGNLPRLESEAVEQHLLSCDACRADFRFQRTLKGAIGDLPREISPPDRVWSGIAERITARSAGPVVSPWWQRRTALAAAAVILIALTSAVTALLVRGPALPRASGNYSVTETAYQRAAEELAATLELRRADLSPAALAVVEHNLRIIDEAIRETQAALAQDPGNERVAELLWASWEKKIDLLERAAQHAES
jgi:predicted anti-sigma-YlaC factor YlaD